MTVTSKTAIHPDWEEAAIEEFESQQKHTDKTDKPEPKSESKRGELPLVEPGPIFLERVQNTPPASHLVKGLIYEDSISLFHGQPRDMKSYCALHIGLEAAFGNAPFNNQRFEVPRPLRVLYLSEEDAESLIAARLKALLKGRQIPENFFPVARRGHTFDTPKGRETIQKTIEASKADLVFFDVLRTFTANSDKGPADLHHVSKFLRMLQVKTTGRGLVLLHHDVKPSRDFDDKGRPRSQNASGGGIFSICDCPVSFQKQDHMTTAVFPEDLKQSGNPKPFTVTFESDAIEDRDGTWHFGPEVTPIAKTKGEDEIKSGGLKTKTLKVLSDVWMTTGELEEKARVPKGGLSPTLRELASSGTVEMVTGEEAKALGFHATAKVWRKVPV
jgi:hypothetical protein